MDLDRLKVIEIELLLVFFRSTYGVVYACGFLFLWPGQFYFYLFNFICYLKRVCFNTYGAKLVFCWDNCAKIINNFQVFSKRNRDLNVRTKSWVLVCLRFMNEIWNIVLFNVNHYFNISVFV